MSLKSQKRDLDHQVWKQIKHFGLQDKKILVALSGGVDSLALLMVLAKVHRLDLLGACYFHHGDGENIEYRNQAAQFCGQVCARLKITYFQLHSEQLVSSEAQFRELRYEAMQGVLQEQGFACIATGHHRDDLLETRILRLIRGTGIQGLTAMSSFSEGRFRPFLKISKSELSSYLRMEGVCALEDPTNRSTDPLRNWLRNDWLPALEGKAPGGVESLSRSIETILAELDHRPRADLLLKNEDFCLLGISRAFYLTLSQSEQRRLLAQYLFSIGKKDFSQSHLEEIQKRLDNSQKVITFKVAGCQWEVNAEQIMVES